MRTDLEPVADLARRIKALAAEATPGPWEVQTIFHDDGPEQCCVMFGEIVDEVVRTPGWYADSSRDHKDAAYIAAANPEAVVRLCDAVLAGAELARVIHRLHTGRSQYEGIESIVLSLNPERTLGDVVAALQEASDGTV